MSDAALLPVLFCSVEFPSVRWAPGALTKCISQHAVREQEEREEVGQGGILRSGSHDRALFELSLITYNTEE